MYFDYSSPASYNTFHRYRYYLDDSGVGEATSLFEFGDVNVSFLLDEVGCRGTELAIEDCPHSPWRHHDCSALEIAGVFCTVSSDGWNTFFLFTYYKRSAVERH